MNGQQEMTKKSALGTAPKIMTRLGIMIALISLALGGLFVSPPDAEAQPAGGEYDVIFTLGSLGEPCPAGEHFIATNTLGTFDLCLADGFGQIGDETACVDGDGTWDSTFGVCSFTGTVIPCDAVVPGTVSDSQYYYEISPGYCADPLFISGVGTGYTPICIEDEKVQNNAEAATTGVGGIFYADGLNYLIATGGPSCTFNCYDGFDVNCDDRLGDYCAVELNRRRVADVGTCLAARAAAEAPPESVPAVPASVPAVSVAAAPVSVLALTGSDANITNVGFALLAFGSLTLGFRRRILDQDR